MLELFPQGFEELEGQDGIELAAYTDPSGEERLWHVFGGVRSDPVEAGWEERWRDFHRPVRIGRLWVGPPWANPPRDAVAVVVDPGRAFGTGGHATTRLCLELLLNVPPGSLLDVGSGSGVLAIAAAKLGFAPVTAIDVDPVAVETTRANVRANRVALEVGDGDARSRPLPAAETVVANITLEAVRAIAPRLRCRRLLTSGYLAAEDPEPLGYQRVTRLEAEGWAADLFERSEEGSARSE
jgi:ribosomal protein L11 methyltransferase